ncbi:MAG: hypothetical protein AB1760_04760 [Pseudomonadota bacterium]
MVRLLKQVGLAGALMLAACGTYPASSTLQGAPPSGLYFKAPAEAQVWLDGAHAGAASAYDGKKAVLSVAPGAHRVVIRSGDRSLYDNTVYVGAGSRIAIEAH